MRGGTDATTVATLLYMSKAMEAAAKVAKEGISVEVIDPRTLVPFDIDTIVASVKNTGRLITVHEAHRTGGMAAELAAQVTELSFPYLDAPPLRLGAKHCTLPFNLGLENAVVPQVEEIVTAVKKTLYK